MIAKFLTRDNGFHSRHTLSLSDVDAANSRVGMRTAENFSPKRPRQTDIGGIYRSTTHFVRALCPRNRNTHYFEISHLRTSMNFSLDCVRHVDIPSDPPHPSLSLIAGERTKERGPLTWIMFLPAYITSVRQ
jgi:hypothetical protein